MRIQRNVKVAFAAFASLAASYYVVPAARAGSAPDFTNDVQPIFVQSCYQCHGPKVQMGGLRLDSKESALAKVIVPGDSANSMLFRRITEAQDQLRMPLGGKPLPPEQIATIKAWIDAGARWPDSAGGNAVANKPHWAWVPPRRPTPPAVKNGSWPHNDIDRFILARLEHEGLEPSPEADRVTLLRRVSLDLTGLPPTPAEVDAFLSDPSPNAYQNVVERLLASPHYGERWGRVWLDGARYADSDGFEKDKSREVWFYRDWVINALNRDLPYDEFVIKQIAGDLLPNSTQDDRVATGFLRNSMINEEGGVDPEQFRMEAMFDRMDAIGKSILGITIQCAQCHNHKYDPLKQEEYYQIFAFLNNSHEANPAVYTPTEQIKRAELFSQIAEIETRMQQQNPKWVEQEAKWEEQVTKNEPEWTVLKPEVDDISTGGERYVLEKDNSLLGGGYAPTKHKLKVTTKTDLQNITAFRLELLTDPNLPRGGPGRSLNGTGALTEFSVEQAASSAPDKTENVKIVRATADINPPETVLDPIFDDKSERRRVTGPIEYAIDGKDETAWGIDAGPALRNQPRKAVFTAEKSISNDGGTVLTFYISQNHGGWNSDDNQNNNLGRIRLAVTTSPDAVADPLPANVREILSIPRQRRTPSQMRMVFSYWRPTVPEWSTGNEKIASLYREFPEGTTQLVLQEREDRRETHVLTRGDFLKPTKSVRGGVPAFLNPLPPGGEPDRLSFAKWLVDRKAPTAARSMVNRIWQAYFGTGIVSTAEDLGTQCEPPSHPELLDWLAVEFMDSGWRLKHMHRLIVESAAYQQRSSVSPQLLEKDPANRLLARGPRFRVDAEIVRDIALQASGLLNDKVGGPSVFPPAPEFLFLPPASYGPKNWIEEKGDNRYRRALYTFRFRSVPYPMLQIFDAPNGDFSCVRRSRSNTPLQALVTLNEPMFVETARGLAAEALKNGGATDEQRLTYAFRRCVSRRPAEKEVAMLNAFLEKQRKRAAEGWFSAWDLTGFNGDKKLAGSTTPAEFAAWTAVSRALLSLDETITKE
jgi:mono/diheme cytochrome c family protein